MEHSKATLISLRDSSCLMILVICGCCKLVRVFISFVHNPAFVNYAKLASDE